MGSHLDLLYLGSRDGEEHSVDHPAGLEPLRISLVTPVPVRSRRGNGVTARRWAGILRDLGHRVFLESEYDGRRVDMLVALHAWRSAPSILRFRARHPESPIIVGMAGTDLYEHIRDREEARRSIEIATRIVVLQAMGVEVLPRRLQPKARVIYQSVPRPGFSVRPLKRVFEVCVLSHLRPVKDPLRAAHASRLLPAESRIRVRHAGGALDDPLAAAARKESDSNPRYQWLGELPRWRSLRLLARSRLLVLSSTMEGGANIVGEALALDTPLLSSEIDGSVGILGRDYPGYFPVGDEQALAALLCRAEREAGFYAALEKACRARSELIDPRRERRSWEELLLELSGVQA